MDQREDANGVKRAGTIIPIQIPWLSALSTILLPAVRMEASAIIDTNNMSPSHCH